jgi:hypothetical protein
VNLNQRINKANNALEKTVGIKRKEFFFRMHPDVMSKEEKRFYEENPNFKGRIIIYTLGMKNLTPEQEAKYKEQLEKGIDQRWQ